MKEQTLQIILLPLATAPLFFWSLAIAVYLFSLPFAAAQELSDREGHRRRKELWARLIKEKSVEQSGKANAQRQPKKVSIDEAFDEIRDLISQETRVQGEFDWPEFYLSPEGETKLREILEKLG